MSVAGLQTAWARLLLGSLRMAGVRDVVISPGARSTPFAWAALQEPGLRCRTVIDERSAAFLAVGHGKVTGEPALLICTSGSAATNYLPAVVEAAESATPLVLVTADRGLELQHVAAPQTIDQTKLFGHHVRAFFDLGAPDAHPRMLRAVQRIAAQAVLTARAPTPGPVHLNARARKPLEPDAGQGPDADGVRETVDRLLAAGAPAGHAAVPAPAPDAIRTLAAACREARRGLIVCGPAHLARAPDAARVAALARATGFPVVAEPASQVRFAAGIEPGHWMDAFSTLLALPGFRETAEPDLLIQLGRPPTAAGWGDYVDRWADAARHVIAPHGWPDPWSSARTVIHAPVEAAVDALVRALADGGPAPAGSSAGDTDPARAAWRERLDRANGTAWRVIEAALADGFPEGAAVRAAVDAVPDGGVLALGNSLPIREVEMFVPATTRALPVWTQRGANGIDGLISGAAGAALASGRPTTLILGDVSFAHDVGGLAAAGAVATPFAIVVLNNGGGRIFERLPIADHIPTGAFDAWLSPPTVDVAVAAAAYGLPHRRAADVHSLAQALADAGRTDGATVVEVAVPGDGTTAHQRALLRALEAELR
jgi:2-succinyl-5-enolpyruvyl-6-hydroxy-3-cyclohexene-1-carboxylate synthase